MSDDLSRLLALSGIPLTEGVYIHSMPELAAFVVTLAEAYDAAPIHDPAADKHWDAAKRHTLEVLFKRVKGSGIDIQFTQDDPYTEFGHKPRMMIRAMLYDILINNRLLIYSGTTGDHPNFSPEENTVFRTIHDYFTHGKLLSTFKQNLLKVIPNIAQGHKPTQEELAKALPQVSMAQGGNMGHSLTARGEFNSCSAHIRLAPKDAAPCLFTEVAGQIAYFMCTAQYATQKVAVLPGFDFYKIGQTIPNTAQDARKAELMQFLSTAEPDQMLPMAIAARQQVKVRILMKNVNSHDF